MMKREGTENESLPKDVMAYEQQREQRWQALRDYFGTRPAELPQLTVLRDICAMLDI